MKAVRPFRVVSTRRVVVIAVLVAVVAAGCGSGGAKDEATTAPPTLPLTTLSPTTSPATLPATTPAPITAPCVDKDAALNSIGRPLADLASWTNTAMSWSIDKSETWAAAKSALVVVSNGFADAADFWDPLVPEMTRELRSGVSYIDTFLQTYPSTGPSDPNVLTTVVEVLTGHLNAAMDISKPLLPSLNYCVS